MQARQVAISENGGATWENQQIETALSEPRCQGAVFSIESKGKQVLLFTNPADSKNRINMTLSISRDQGKSWAENMIIYKGHSAYSDLVQMENEKILVLFEAGLSSPYEGIHYKIMSVK